MARELPPSKFGAGTTYGEAGTAHALPQSPPPPPAPTPPPYPATPGYPDPYGTAAYQPSPAPDPSTAPHQSAPDSQFVTLATYSSPTPMAVPVAHVAGANGTAAMVAAILGLAGAIWYGIDLIRNWQQIEFAFQLIGVELSGATALVYGNVAAVIAQFAVVILLLVGGIMLLARSSAGRMMVLIGSVLVIAANAYWAFAAYQAVELMNTYAEETGIGYRNDGEIVGRILLNIGLPALLAIVALVLVMSGSARQWCQRSAGYPAPTPY